MGASAVARFGPTGHGCLVTTGNPHAQIDVENFERDRRLASVIRQRPDALELARRNLQNWAGRWGGLNPAWEEWSQVLRMLTPAQVADFLESGTPMSNRLRQSSPFLGVLEEVEAGGHAVGQAYAA